MREFSSNYPQFERGRINLLSTPERLSALTDYTGRGVVMAFIDSGFSMHPDIADRVLLHADASTLHVVETPGVPKLSPLSWHGQMTSVIAAGDGRTSNRRFRGLACDSHLVLVKVSTPEGQIKERDILRGLRWVLDTHRRLKVRIVNLSVGGDFVSNDPAHPIYRAVHKLTEAGVTVITAAGNRGTEELVPPASAPHAITVGGYDDHNTLDQSAWKMFHSSYGTAYDGTRKPDMIAPAAWIASPILPDSEMAEEARWLAPLLNGSSDSALETLLHDAAEIFGLTPRQASHPESNRVFHLLQERINKHKLIDAHHQHVDGTSVSTAIVSSVAAQMLEASPNLTPSEIRDILVRTAVPLPHTSHKRQGAGMLNAAEAVREAARTQS
ncbi:MAG: S8 family serine peptidase [Anaerolineae bacterium]|nr:S8 family serine peptidase [Anaerolineae bacterium]